MPKCKTCGAEIRWERTTSGKAIPLDAEPHPEGNISIRSDGVAVVLPKRLAVEARKIVAEEGPGEVPRLYRSHFVSCPDREQHRKGR